jgi:uncharacterized protein with HEPN domain
VKFAGRTTSAEFLTDEFAQSAIHYQIQIIGEAAYKVSTEFREQHPEIAWEPIAGLRHRLVHDFNGIEDFAQKVDFYQHDQHWSHRMILGDSLLVMTSLAEKEG